MKNVLAEIKALKLVACEAIMRSLLIKSINALGNGNEMVP